MGMDPVLNEAIATRNVTAVEGVGGIGRVLVPFWIADSPRYLIDLRGAQISRRMASRAAELIAILVSYFQRLVDAETDPLTGLSSRRVFYSQVGTCLAEWTAQRVGCSWQWPT